MSTGLVELHFTPRRWAQIREISTETTMLAYDGQWDAIEAVVAVAEAEELVAARGEGERYAVRRFYAWVRSAHITRQ